MIETKKVLSYEPREYIEDLKSFGWQQTDEIEERSGRHTTRYIILARDKEMQNYNQIVELESKYKSLRSKLETYEPIDGIYALILFLILILPGIVYVVFKNKQKGRIQNNNNLVRSQMKEVVESSRKLL